MSIHTVYKSIDLIKFIMALFVVTIHCNIINNIDNKLFNHICTSIIYSAVPFFYVHLLTYYLDTLILKVNKEKETSRINLENTIST